ncbi:hypothetical protein [Frankia sp. CcI49]|uniref:hypothetical protein n=1 Tax=Frankia sp. CcI49 TaxID=1745382 RepID=UPI000A0743BE|nr:hypothetical protein [Frankia sp. CcI49]
MARVTSIRMLVPAVLAVAALACAGVLIGLAALDSGSSGPAAGQSTPSGAAPSPAASPAATGSPGPDDGAALSEAERELAARLSSFELTDCVSATAEATSSSAARGPTSSAATGVVAALRCAPGVAGGGRPPAEVIVLGYADSPAMAADAARRSTATVDVGSCEAGQTSSEAYLLPSRRSGTFVCEAAAGRFTAYWTIDRERVGFIAATDDPTGLITWWRTFDPL